MDDNESVKNRKGLKEAMYTYNKKILFSDIDYTSGMSVSALLNAMQDCVNINSESIGRGIDYMMEHKRSWFAVSWNIHIGRLPRMFEDVVVKTWPYDFKATMGFRNIIITDSTGEDIVCADSIWALMDMETGRPVKVSEEDAKGYDLEPRYDMPPMERKIKLPEKMDIIDYFTVRKSNVDYNGHMSNGEYIKLASDYLPDGFGTALLRVEYKNQARLGEKLVVRHYNDEASHGYVIAGAEKGDVKAAIVFAG